MKIEMRNDQSVAQLPKANALDRSSFRPDPKGLVDLFLGVEKASAPRQSRKLASDLRGHFETGVEDFQWIGTSAGVQILSDLKKDAIRLISHDTLAQETLVQVLEEEIFRIREIVIRRQPA